MPVTIIKVNDALCELLLELLVDCQRGGKNLLEEMIVASMLDVVHGS